MKQLDLATLSQDEKNSRLAAAVTSYGVGTRSYNRSAEKKELERQREEVTERYRRGELKMGQVVIGPICTCRSFDLPHQIKKHSELRGDSDWRLQSERHARYQPDGVR